VFAVRLGLLQVDASLYASLGFSDLVLVIWRKNDTVFRCDINAVGPALFGKKKDVELIARIHPNRRQWMFTLLLIMPTLEFIDADGDLKLTVDEILKAMAEPQLIEFVKAVKCPVLLRLFKESERIMRSSFKKIDADKSGEIDLAEWMSFLGSVQVERLQFYKQCFLLKNYTYSGHGMEPGEPFSQAAIDLGLVRGWWEDFKYYTCNQHPLFVMFYADRTHPYSVNQRRAEFMAAIMTTFFGAGILILSPQDAYLQKFFLALVLVTIPTAIFRKIAYYLFVAPCFIVDKSKTSDAKDACFMGCTSCAACIGYLLSCSWGLVFFSFGLIFWLAFGATWLSFADWVGSIIQLWFIWFFMAMTFDFNPIPGVEKTFAPVNWFIGKVTCGMVPLRVGRWHIERAKVHGIIRDKVEKRGKTRFFLPDTLDADTLRTAPTAGDEDGAGGPLANPFAVGADLREPDVVPDAVPNVVTSSGDVEVLPEV